MTKRRVQFGTKTCPCCGAVLYADMCVCYGCLYDFSRERPRAETAPKRSLSSLPQLPDPARPPAPPGSGALSHGAGRPSPRASSALRRPSAAAAVLPRVPQAPVPGVRICSALMDVWVAVPDQGLVVGRDPSCDVVLHAPAVSLRHARLAPTPDGMEVCDLGATNPPVYAGREVVAPVVVPYGEEVDLCGYRLVMTGQPGVSVR